MYREKIMLIGNSETNGSESSNNIKDEPLITLWKKLLNYQDNTSHC